MHIEYQSDKLLILCRPILPVIIGALVLAFPGLIVWAIIFLSGTSDYVVFKCQRINAQNGHCQFLRVSPLRPYYYRFPLAVLKGTERLQGSSSRASSRVALKTSTKIIPFTFYESTGLNNNKIQTKIRTFIDDPDTQSLTIRIWPHWGLLMLVPLSLPSFALALDFLARSSLYPMTLQINRASQQITLHQWFILGKRIRHCSFEQIKEVGVKREERTLKYSKGQTSVRYVFHIDLYSDTCFFRYSYDYPEQAEAIAQLIFPLLK